MATILVVDDRQTNRELVVTLLGYAGHRLLEATEGEEGLEIARREHPDLIITDIVMPTMDGYEFARRVRADPSINSTQIIFHTSSYIVSETRRLAEACGVSIVLSKPIEPEIFLEKVNEALTLPSAPVVSPASEDFHLAHMRLLTDTLAKKVEQLEAEVIERKRAEAALQTSEELFRSAFQYSPIGMCITSVDGKLQTVNQSLIDMLGFSGSELEGKHFNDITYSEDLEIGQDIVSRMVSGEVQGVAFEKRYVHKSGAPVWAHVSSTLLRDTSGKPIHFITQILDITERKRVEERNRFLANLVAEVSDAIIAVDLQQKIQSWNNGAESLYGWKEQEVLGRPSKDILDTDFIGMTRAAVTKQIMEQGSWSGEALQLHRDGTRIPVQSSVALYKDSEGRPAGIVAVNSDITERKRAEEQLRQSEENFSKAFSSSPTALMITRRADGKYLELNKAYTSIVGYERSELIGRLTTEFNIFTNPDQRKEIVSQLVTNGSLYNYEAQIQNKSGELRTVLASLEQIQFNGEDCILTTIVDITARKQAEEAVHTKNEEIKAMSQQLWQAAKLATMGELAASIAHELNNPLATVSLRAEMLQAQFGSEDPQSKSLLIIASEVKRMSSLVMNLLQFSRRSSSQTSTIKLNDEVASTLELVQYHLRKNSIQTVQELSAEIPLIQADRQQLRQVFLNLFTNAADAMPLGGMLIIRTWSGEKPDAGITAPLQRSTVPSLGLPISEIPQVFIEISDTGEGITSDKLEKVWEPFYTTKPEGKGTGLGLAICRRIIQEHGGTIEVHSEGIPGKGTTVRLSLPAVKER